MATKKKPAAKSTRTKRTMASAKKKATPKKASSKKRLPKAQSASSARNTSKKSSVKPTKNNKNKKSVKQQGKAEQATQTGSRADERVTIDRRSPNGRRKEAVCDVPQPKLERRKKVQRRRQIDPTTCERDYSLGEVEFMSALDDYKRKSGRMFPTCSEILEVIHALGYIKLSSAEIAARNSSQKSKEKVEEVPVGSEILPEHQEADDLEDLESFADFDGHGSKTLEQNLQWTSSEQATVSGGFL